VVVWVAGKVGMAGAFRAHVARVGVRVDNPVVFTCPGLIYELRPKGAGFGSEPENTAVHESDCAPGEEWESPSPRPYALPQGVWEITVRFCANGVDGKSCRRGPSKVETVTVTVN
jgi:hypothetical protein